jgi:hypothetical protein
MPIGERSSRTHGAVGKRCRMSISISLSSRLVGEALLDAVLQLGVVEPQSSRDRVGGIDWCEVLTGGVAQMLGNAAARRAGAPPLGENR